MKTDATIAELEKIARDMFPANEFVRERRVCHFGEHETVDGKGRPQQYDRRALEAIAAACNERILDTGNFAVLSEGHTPEPEDAAKGAPQPAALGFAGIYRLGKIGRKKPRYALFADEWHFRDCHDKVKKLPRRSVELWMDPDMTKRFFDPVACLGAEAPRLDLGLRFARLPSGQVVEKYTAVAPGGGNTFAPEFTNDAPKERYEGDRTMLQPEELQQILSAINELDFVQWTRQQMEADMRADDAGEDDKGQYMADEEPPEEDAEMFDEPPPEEGAEPPAEEADPEMSDEPPAEEADDDDDEKEPYSKSRKRHMATKPTKTIVERYRRLEADHKATVEKYQALQGQVTGLLRERADAQRYARLVELANERPLDMDDELKRCLYSKGSEMSDKAFADHVATIERYSQPLPTGADRLPLGELPPRAATDSERAEQVRVQAAINLAEKYRREGKRITFDQCYAEIEHAGAGNGK